MSTDLTVDTDLLRLSAEAVREAGARYGFNLMSAAGIEMSFNPASLGPSPHGAEVVRLAQRRVQDAVAAVRALSDSAGRYAGALDNAAVTFASTESMLGPR